MPISQRGWPCPEMGKITVTDWVHDNGDADFWLHNNSNNPDWVSAHGFLRSDELIVKIDDDSNTQQLICTITRNESASAFEIGAVLGRHEGFRLEDDMIIDRVLLQRDSYIRTGVEVGRHGPEWGALSTMIDGFSVISDLLRRLDPSMETRFGPVQNSRPFPSLSVSDIEKLDERIVSLVSDFRNEHGLFGCR